MAALDLFGRRWSLRVVWELRNGPLTFRALQAACGSITPSVLNTRLAELREAGIVSLFEAGYELTDLGKRLHKASLPLNAWAEEWAARIPRT